MIDIVIAIYNPTEYLDEQVDSLLKQTYIDKVARIILVDDGSTPDSMRIVERNVNKDPRLELHRNTSGKHGAKHNFSFGLSLTSAEYIMNCDQDDYWFEDKIERTFLEIFRLERTGKDIPLLVGTDVTVTDAELKEINNSFFSLLSNDRPHSTSKESLLTRNIVPGCTMLFNRQLLNLALPVPEKALMHDWWLLLIACYNGRYSIIKQPTMYYRQHGNNCIGAVKPSTLRALSSRRISQNLDIYYKHFNSVIEQAKMLENNGNHQIINDFKAYSHWSILRKVWFINKYNIDGPMKKLSFSLKIIMNGSQK
ncbi:MAG: glycosyltransferase family 2 protein [Saccharospirillaceae bacterium]|nr:glycosyltransferase family 2 protein [Saccharospirillaceae bacterium]